jgi:hypothetical protein
MQFPCALRLATKVLEFVRLTALPMQNPEGWRLVSWRKTLYRAFRIVKRKSALHKRVPAPFDSYFALKVKSALADPPAATVTFSFCVP